MFHSFFIVAFSYTGYILFPNKYIYFVILSSSITFTNENITIYSIKTKPYKETRCFLRGI